MKSFFLWQSQEFGFLNPYIIAEIGVNHAGDLDLAKKQILLAKKAGAHAVKFQAYKADTIASPLYSPAYWDLNKEKTSSQYQLFSCYDVFTPNDYKILAQFCVKNHIDFSCTPFDLNAVEFLDPLVPFFKIASADITNIPLLRAISAKGKPIVLSVGASHWDEIDFAINTLNQVKQNPLALLHCVLNYPTPYSHAQMSLLDELYKKYGSEYIIGYSDHIPGTKDNEFPALDLAVLRGSFIIEKHFSHNINLEGNDHYHAFSPEGLKTWVKKLKDLQTLYGFSTERNLEYEKQAIDNARRHLFVNKNLIKGSIIKPDDIIALRSNKGLPAKNYDNIIGKLIVNNKKQGDFLTKEDFI